MSWLRMCANLTFLQFRRCEREKDAIVAEDRSLLPSGSPTVQGYFTSEVAEMLTLFRNGTRE